MIANWRQLEFEANVLDNGARAQQRQTFGSPLVASVRRFSAHASVLQLGTTWTSLAWDVLRSADRWRRFTDLAKD
jgi:hypothetical protein